MRQRDDDATTTRRRRERSYEVACTLPKMGTELAPVFSTTSASGSVSHAMVTNAFTLPGYRIARNLGVVRGIVVRSRSVIGNLGAGLQMLVGGNITIYTRMCEQARQEAYDLMLRHAAEHGANAIVGMRYDATELGAGISEVLAYGTAVQVEPEPDALGGYR